MLEESKKRGLRFMSSGLFLAALCTWLLISAYNQAIAQQPAPKPLVGVLYARQPLPAYATIAVAVQQSDQLPMAAEGTAPGCPIAEQPTLVVGAFQLCLVDAQFVLSQAVQFPAITTLADLELPEQQASITQFLLANFADHFTTVALQPGEPLQRQLLATAVIPSDMRAVSIGVNGVTSVDHRVQPGDRVDVIVSYEDGNNRPTSALLLQNVQVWQPLLVAPAAAIDGTPMDGALINETSAIVTLLLPPADALTLTHMENFAKEVRLLLRSRGDHTLLQLPPVAAFGNGN